MSIIITLSGSTRISRPGLKPPAWSHVHAVEIEPWSLPCERSPKNDHTAPANATKTLIVESQPAARREIRVPQSVISRAPPSGAARQSQAPAIIRGAPRGGRRRARAARGFTPPPRPPPPPTPPPRRPPPPAPKIEPPPSPPSPGKPIRGGFR